MSDLTRQVTIYGLLDSEDLDRRIRYVGATTQTLERRVYRHTRSAEVDQESWPVSQWIRAIGSPRLQSVLLEENVSWSVRHERERFWIDLLKTHSSDHELGLNDAHASVQSAAAGAKNGAIHAKLWEDQEYRARMLPVVLASRRLASLSGAHSRWHVKRGIVKPGCQLCEESAV